MKKLYTLVIFLVLAQSGYSQSVEAFEEELKGARNQTLRINALFSVAFDNSTYGSETFVEDQDIINSYTRTVSSITADLEAVEKNSNTAQVIENYNPNFGTTADVISRYIEGYEKWAASNMDEIKEYDGSGNWFETFILTAKNVVEASKRLDNEIAMVVNEIRGHY